MAVKRIRANSVRVPSDIDPGGEHIPSVAPAPSFDVFAAVHADLRSRDEKGWREHRMPLDARDPSRDWLKEAYEEALDLAVYLKAQMMRRG